MNKKSVRFGEPQVVCTVAARSELTAVELNATWWSPAAMNEFFRSAKTFSKRAQGSNFMVAGFEHAFEYAKQRASSLNKTVVFHWELENVQVEQELVDWCRFGHSWRGLERRSSFLHDEDRAREAFKAKSIILEMKDSADTEAVRRAYERASRSFKIFARMMAEADAMVVKVQSLSMRKNKSLADLTVQVKKNSRQSLLIDSVHCIGEHTVFA